MEKKRTTQKQTSMSLSELIFMHYAVKVHATDKNIHWTCSDLFHTSISFGACTRNVNQSDQFHNKRFDMNTGCSLTLFKTQVKRNRCNP